MSLPDGKLIDSDVPNGLERSLLEPSTKVLFEHILDEGPTHPKETSHVFDRSDLAQINDVALETLEISTTTVGKQNRLPELHAASTAHLFVTVKHDQLPPRSNWKRCERPLEPTIENKLAGVRTTALTSPFIIRQLDMVDDCSFFVLSRQVPVASKTKCVIQKACRRHRGPSFVCSTKEDRPPGGDFSSHVELNSNAAIHSFAG